MQAKHSHAKNKILNARGNLRAPLYLSVNNLHSCWYWESVSSYLFFSFCFLTQIPCVVKAGLQLMLALLAQFLSARVTGLHYYTWLCDSCEFRACGDFQSGQLQDPPSTQILSQQPPLAPGTVREQLPNTIKVFHALRVLVFTVPEPLCLRGRRVLRQGDRSLSLPSMSFRDQHGSV